MPGRCIFLLGLLLSFFAPIVSAEVVPFLDLGFLFDYDIPGDPVRIPVTQQCETIHIKWSRGSATGPNPVAPYSLTVYTSTFVQPFMIPAGNGLSFDWAVPFAPGTQYMICMWDANGVSGGCQEKYTMIPNLTNSSITCANTTFVPQLDVQGTTSGGPLSMFGFNDQCTDVTIKPLNGTPPYRLTVAPPLHPPYNITTNSRDEAIAWTVSLSRSMPYWMSLVSADGFAWANGPMHSGGGGNTDCLAPGTISSKKAKAIAAGAGIGGLFGGALLLAVAFVCLQQWRKRRRTEDDPFEPINTASEVSPGSTVSLRTGTITPTARSLRRTESVSTLQSHSPTHESPLQEVDVHRYPSMALVTSTTRNFRSESLYTPTTTGGGLRYVQHHDAFPAVVVDLPPSYGGIRQPQRSETLGTETSIGLTSSSSSPVDDWAPPVPEKAPSTISGLSF